MYQRKQIINKITSLRNNFEVSMKKLEEQLKTPFCNELNKRAFRMCIGQQLEYIDNAIDILSETESALVNDNVNHGNIKRFEELTKGWRKSHDDFNSTWDQLKHEHKIEYYELERAYFDLRGYVDAMGYYDQYIESLKSYIHAAPNNPNIVMIGNSSNNIQVVQNSSSVDQCMTNYRETLNSTSREKNNRISSETKL